MTAITIVIPIYNEEAILHAAVVDLRTRLEPLGWAASIMLAENGSTDGTRVVAEALAAKYDDVSWFSVGEPNYGLALRRGIERADTPIVICEEIDLCDVDFHERAVALLEGSDVDLVVGSKLAPGASDERPVLRHGASLVYSGLLRVAFGFRGTDTHGLKAFRRATVAPVASRCVVDRDVFASELVIRAHREGLDVREIPVRTLEKRPPSINLMRRVPGVLKNLARLALAIRAGR